ncbi:MAG: LpqN/LpqT family lipoprotein [Actinomycetota bacterium]|nr:LpqN/LpqT family lipoprotein [Actinomycetota bacterium]
MTARPVLAAVLAAALACGCTTEAPDYQSVWSTPSSATTAPEPTATQPEQVPLSQFLEEIGVVGQPVAPDKLTDLTVSIPTPQGWEPYRDASLAPGTRMIAKGDTYPTAMLMVFELDGEFDAATALTHADVDAEMSENFRRLGGSDADFNGFPSSVIEGSYDLAGSRMHTYNRVVIATGAAPQRQRYLVQFTVTGYADKAAEEAPDIEAIIEGFTVEVPA